LKFNFKILIMENSFTLLDIAYDDIKASKLLYKNDLLPQSIFYLQQAVEKSIKQLGLYNGVIKRSDLQKEIGHKADKIFKKLAFATKHIINNNEQDIINDYNKLSQLIKNNDLEEFKEVIKKALDAYHRIEISQELVELIICEIIKKENSDFYKKVKKNQNLEHQYNRMKERFKKYFPDYIKSVMILFSINLIVSDYVSTVRYPVGDKFENPALFFDPNHPLVQLIPIYIKNCEFALKGISDFQLMNNY